jgi:hypothetical protein
VVADAHRGILENKQANFFMSRLYLPLHTSHDVRHNLKLEILNKCSIGRLVQLAALGYEFRAEINELDDGTCHGQG